MQAVERALSGFCVQMLEPVLSGCGGWLASRCFEGPDKSSHYELLSLWRLEGPDESSHYEPPARLIVTCR